LAYFDENSQAGKWWMIGHGITREHYAFLLERVLEDPGLGLVLKPKVPATLRARLGPVAQLLERAERTGRCYVFADGVLHGNYPPAAAALAADVAIHGHASAGTAACEAALAGVPTLVMDREGWPASPLYRLGEGNVVFRDWPTLWDACRAHWARPGSVPGFGDWSPLLDDLDPFRDGRAGSRLASYIRSLLDVFQSGGNREDALAAATEQYAAKWGHHMVIEAGAYIGATVFVGT
jgi:hypothetical protein